MIYLFTALYCEAQIFIRQYNLKKDAGSARFQVFYNEDIHIRLTVTGVGEIMAAAAVSHVCTAYKPQRGDVLLNVGICAGPEGYRGVFLCNKLIEQATGKSFYPDILYLHSFQEGEIETGMRPWDAGSREIETELRPWDAGSVEIETGMRPWDAGSREIETGMQPWDTGSGEIVGDGEGAWRKNGRQRRDGGLRGGPYEGLYDMEAAAVYQVGTLFFGPHQMVFLKIVSDHGREDAARVTPGQVLQLSERYQDELFRYIRQLLYISQEIAGQDGSGDGDLDGAYVAQVCGDMCCSRTMGSLLKQYMRYANAAGIGYQEILKAMYAEGRLPCRDKKEGKRCLDEFQQRIFYTPRLKDLESKPWRRVVYTGQHTANDNGAQYNRSFSHIYVESSVRDHPRTKRILERYPGAQVIEIGHYKDVFCRSGQDQILQHRAQSLIVAAKQGTLLYPGASVCQSFGQRHFYYTSCIMNCIYDCEYCYLKGMYPSAYLVVFVNLEDIFAQAEQVLAEHPLYLCVSYDTDLLAVEQVFGYVGAWIGFAAEHPDILLEVRTKCANRQFFKEQAPLENVIYAFTLSPQAVAGSMEHHAPSFAERLRCAAQAVEMGFPVRLCFDPMIYIPDWQHHYGEMLQQIYEAIDMEQIVDVSVGSFRIGKDYLKKMRKQEPASAVVQFPYQYEDGVYRYPDALLMQMEQYLVDRLKERISEERIFLWKEGTKQPS